MRTSSCVAASRSPAIRRTTSWSDWPIRPAVRRLPIESTTVDTGRSWHIRKTQTRENFRRSKPPVSTPLKMKLRNGIWSRMWVRNQCFIFSSVPSFFFSFNGSSVVSTRYRDEPENCGKLWRPVNMVSSSLSFSLTCEQTHTDSQSVSRIWLMKRDDYFRVDFDHWVSFFLRQLGQ